MKGRDERTPRRACANALPTMHDHSQQGTFSDYVYDFFRAYYNYDSVRRAGAWQPSGDMCLAAELFPVDCILHYTGLIATVRP